MKIKCKCGKITTWYYMPAEEEWACCDDCVPRGCTCEIRQAEYELDGEIWFDYPEDGNYGIEGKNWEWIDEMTWQLLDNGRPYPCCEWWYDKEGWDDED